MSPSRRRCLGLGAAALTASLSGCSVGLLEPAESADETPADATSDRSDAMTVDPTVDTSLPDGRSALPEGPKPRPARPADLTAETVREYVRAFEYRWVYNALFRDETTEVHAECGVDSVTEYGVGFRVVVWCAAWADTERNGTTYHADYFTQYATYYVGPESTTRREGRTDTRE